MISNIIIIFTLLACYSLNFVSASGSILVSEAPGLNQVKAKRADNLNEPSSQDDQQGSATKNQEISQVEEAIAKKAVKPWPTLSWNDHGHNSHFLNRRILEELSTDGTFENGKRPALPREIIIPMLDQPERWITTQRSYLGFKNGDNPEDGDPALLVGRSLDPERDGHRATERIILSTASFKNQAILNNIRAAIFRFEYRSESLSHEEIEIDAQIQSPRSPSRYIIGTRHGVDIEVRAELGVTVGVEWQVMVPRGALRIGDYLRLTAPIPELRRDLYITSASIEVLSWDRLALDPRTGRIVDPTVDRGRVRLVDPDRYIGRNGDRVQVSRKTSI